MQIETYSISFPKKSFEVRYKPDECGEDSFFVYNQNNTTLAMGVADGVGGWQEFNINSGLFSQNLMLNTYNTYHDQKSLHPLKLMEIAYSKLLEQEKSIYGSSTYCTITYHYNQDNIVAKTNNIGDSGYIIIRKNKIIYRSNRQLDGLSPKQIANIPPHLSDVGCINTPFFESESNEHILEENDLIILATDGFWDNIYDSVDIMDHTKVLSSTKEIAHDLIKFAKEERKKSDDITILVSRVMYKID